MRVIGAGFLVFFGGVFVAAPAALAGQATPAIERGQRVYAAQKCAACHAIGGRGNARGPLDEVGSNLSVEEIREWMVDPKAMTVKTKSTRRPPMPDYKDLRPEDLDALVAYMQSLKKQP